MSSRPGAAHVLSPHHASKSFSIAASLALVLAVASTAGAAWPPDGAPVTTAPGEQFLQSTLPDGHGGVYVFWRDNRLGYDYAPRFDIYGQHLDSRGDVVAGWDSLGNAIANSDAQEVDARGVSDGAGGAIVMWSVGDYRLQHVHANGSQSWGPNGIAVADSGVYRVSGHLMPDGAGGVYVVWADAALVPTQALCPHCHPIYTYHLFAQRIDASGNRLWGSKGLPVIADSIGATIMLLEGNEGAPLILWSDALGTIRAQEFDPDGHPRLAPEGQPIPNLRLGITAVTGPRQAVTAYLYGSDTNEDIGAQRLGSDLAVDWGDAGEPVITAPHKQEPTGIAGDGEGGVLLAWHDVRSAVDWDVYLTRLTAQGTVSPGWPDQGLPICTLPENQTSPTVMSDGAGGAFVAWIDLRNPANDYDLYLKHVLGNGTIAPGWPDQGLAICTQPQTQADPQLVTDGHGGIIVAWNDVRRGAEIYAQQVSPDGTIGDEFTAITASLMTLELEVNDVVAEWQVDTGVDHVDVMRSSGANVIERIGEALIDGSHRARFVDRNVSPGRYGYAIQFAYNGTTVTSAFGWIDVVPISPLALAGFRPNPSDGKAPVAFVLPEAGSVRVEIFDVRGRRVRDLSATRLDAGSHAMDVGARLPAGAYWIRLRTRERSVSTRGVALE